MKSYWFYFLSFLLVFTSCSTIKNPHSNNFRKVKYHAHLKKAKTLQETPMIKTVDSFKEEERDSEVKEKEVPNTTVVASVEIENENKIDQEIITTSHQNKLFKKKALSPNFQSFLKEINSFHTQDQETTNTFQASDWWDDDPEDWPWKELILVAIAILLIALIIFLVVDLFGGVIGGLLGLILLLLLAYFIIDYFW